MDARTSRYHEVYARAMRDPEGFWGEASAGDRLVRAGEESLRPGRRRLRPLVHRRLMQHLLQRDRPPCGARPRQPARDHLRFAGHQHQARHHLCGAAARGADARRDPAGFRRHQGRPRHPLHADGARGAVRDVCLRAHRRDPFGGVRRLRAERARDPPRRLQAEADPLGLLRHRGRARRAVQAAARRRDRSVQCQARGLPDPAAPAGRGPAHRRPRSRLGGAARRRRSRRTSPRLACRCSPPTRSTSSTPRARPAFRKAWCATMAATWSRSPGRCRTTTTSKPGEVYWAASDIGWVVGHSYIVYAPLFHGCTTILYEGKPVGTPDAGAFWRVIAEHQCVAMFTAPTAFRAIKKEDPGGQAVRAIRFLANSARCSSRASAPIRRRSNGPSSC